MDISTVGGIGAAGAFADGPVAIAFRASAATSISVVSPDRPSRARGATDGTAAADGRDGSKGSFPESPARSCATLTSAVSLENPWGGASGAAGTAGDTAAAAGGAEQRWAVGERIVEMRADDGERLDGPGLVGDRLHRFCSWAGVRSITCTGLADARIAGEVVAAMIWLSWPSRQTAWKNRA